MSAREALTSGLLAASTLSLRVVTIYFLRFLPLGGRFLSTIYYSFALYLTVLLYDICRQRGGGRLKSKKTAAAALNFWGWFDTRNVRATLCGFLINLLCLLATLDFLYRSHLLHDENHLSFSRVGYVDDQSARIILRAPDAPIVSIEYRLDDDSAEWQQGPTLEHSNDAQDQALTFALSSLQPDKTYQYRTNSSHNGRFRTSHPHPKRWTLVSSSCIKPFYPYNPLDHSLRIPGLEYLTRFIQWRKIEFVLFLGDFIYIDLPTRFGWETSDYQKAYRQVYGSPSWSEELLSIPWLHMYDDHEITNDWASNETGLYGEAIPPYMAYHHGGNPLPLQAADTFYTFNRGDISFFVTDTRRYRSPEHIPDGAAKTMLGKRQIHELAQWLETEPRWKVLVTSVPFTRNWRGPESIDSWAGYLWERQYLLDFMFKTPGVIILSGDRHEHATTAFPGPDGSVTVVEFSTSPLSQFYQPFDRKYQQIESTDVEIYSHPYGVSKFGVLTFDTSVSDNLTAEFELIVDGKSAWNYTFTI